MYSTQKNKLWDQSQSEILVTCM